MKNRKKEKFSAVFFFSIFGHQNPGSGIRIHWKSRIRILIQGIQIHNTSKNNKSTEPKITETRILGYRRD
jgi:hypothetical protein